VRKQINVVGAVVIRDGSVLCAQRGGGGALAGLWEFPGGKIEPNETAREALIREIDEELRCVVSVGDEVTTTSHDYEFGTVVLTTFYCDLLAGEPVLTEHTAVRWLTPENLQSVPWAPADVPAVEIIQGNFRP